jgi:hypothetical protein
MELCGGSLLLFEFSNIPIVWPAFGRVEGGQVVLGSIVLAW